MTEPLCSTCRAPAGRPVAPTGGWICKACGTTQPMRSHLSALEATVGRLHWELAKLREAVLTAETAEMRAKIRAVDLGGQVERLRTALTRVATMAEAWEDAYADQPSVADCFEEIAIDLRAALVLKEERDA